jgi:TatD DNase family protein
MFEPDDLDGVMDRAAVAGVGGVLVPSTAPDDLDLTLELAVRWSGRVVAAVGLHPHEASSLGDSMKRRIRQACAADGAVAVGEIGLDYHYMNSPREDQIRALEWQLDLAIEVSRPVVLHNRESWSDLEKALTARSGRLRGVCHSFTEGPTEARRVRELGLLVGISGMVTFKQAHNIREMAAALRPSDVMVETDAPFLAPVPHRGRRNEPAYVALVGDHLAREMQVPSAELEVATSDNFRALFGLEPEWPARSL